MEYFNIIASIASILSLIIALITLNKVVNIYNNLFIDKSRKTDNSNHSSQNIKTRDNTNTTINQVGRDKK
ncbi:hypothetical protein AJ85_18050 [Alkalihalobacillus alcalophilus ATCC 27647 = CGMCC 1.3604]|uniref:Uncharacterized protein n=1 Tax=Alkalihalobacillus alcalophilus ATCC 27647 = CGMCC 1.3604 TaxID=1218173 RepID=A0A094WDQ4_ALKAL|nr:hypothetical protein BALCAV_0219710 [Alkalihalobacillus alcalophilus ATCC 27647 = CGMCC 1.3604]THG89369.1 hypothetical protein AJ85_18050 [Alkalihalobacillus alcalophilus ATCC 27647 = CGMCC 1.3604]